MLKILKSLENWDPEGAKWVESNAYKALAAEAGVTPKTWKKAANRVYSDGPYGPLAPKEWAETTGDKRFAHVSDALKVIHASAGARIPDVEYTDYDYEVQTDERGNDVPNAVIEGDSIKREIFHWYVEIYGRMP